MANPNPAIWGDSSTWINAPYSYGLTSTLASTVNAAKPKVNDFQSDSTNVWDSSLYRAIQQGVMTLNDYLDNTICPCGHDPVVSPFSKLAVINEDNSLSVADSHIRIVERNENINWFFADRTSQVSSSQGYMFSATYSSSSSTDTLDNQQLAPKAKALDSNNINFQICPYTYYGIKTFVLRIQVRCIAKTQTGSPAIYSTWRTLDTWKNTYAETEDIIGLRFRVMTCNQINTSTLALTYDSSGSISSGNANVLCVTNPIAIVNNGDETDTQILTLFTQGNNERSAYIFDITQSVYNYDDYRRGRAVLPCYNYFDGQTLKRYKPTSDPNAQFYYSIPYSDDTYNKILQIAALFGCYFTPTNKVTFAYDMTDNDLYLPIIDDNGIAHGQYTNGADNANNNLYSKNSIRDIDYDPSKPPSPVDPNTYSNTTGFNYITEGAAMTVRYVLDGENVDKLLSDLWTINASIAQGGDFEYFDGKIKDEYLTTNPIDCIVSLIRYPFNIPYQLQPLQSYVKLGKTEGSAKGWTTIYIANQINFQGIDIFPRFGDCFLDYEPYTTYELYVPFCGTIKIRAADILGHTLNVTMLIDLITGSCTAYVKADQLVIETLQGSCGVQQQISGTDTATMNANIYNGILAQKQAKAGLIAQGASAFLPSNWVNPIGYAAKGEQAEASYKQATYAIEHIETPVHSQGAASPLLGWIQEFDARLLIYYPEGDVIESTIPPSLKQAPLAAFGHLKGFATATPGIVSNFQMSGKAAYLSGDIIPDAIPCTLSERNRIKSMFADGVYLPPL